MHLNLVEKLLALTLIGVEWVLWLLLLASILSIAVILERFIFYRKIKIDLGRFTSTLSNLLIEHKYDAIETLCQQSPAPESQIVLAGLKYRGKGAKAMHESMLGFSAGMRQYLDRGLVVLGTLGNNAPFIGLFGTVIGIIQAFNSLSQNPTGGPSIVMSGISEALVATAVGLLVAIPAVIANNTFNRIVKRHVANTEAIMRLILTHEGQS